VPSLATINALAAAYVAASVFCRKKVGSEYIRRSNKPSTGCVGKRATIMKILMNPAMAAIEICMAWEEIRRLRCELAWKVLQEAIDKDGAVLSDGTAGNQIRRAVGIMDGPVTEALQLGASPEALELWRVHTMPAHITVIQLYCMMKGGSISPQSMNTDTVEWFFGDAQQMVDGSTNKLTAAGFNRANKKASTFNAAKFYLVGNNSTGANMFGRNKKF
jgi:hypothetical protein